MDAKKRLVEPEAELASGSGRVMTVNVGGVREIEWLGRTWTTAIWKSPVGGRVALRGVNLAGDDQADREVHGGTDKAVYAYAREDAAWWESQLGRTVEPGSFGENLTLEGIAVTDAVVGDRWEIGSAVLEVAQPRIPCFKLGARMNDQDFPRRFAEAGRPGAYLRIIQEGDVGEGDEVRVVHRPSHGVSVGEVAHVYHHDHSGVKRLLSAPELAEGWRVWAEKIGRHLKA
jgi:MOSC domain-containing protein YiiM